MVYPFLKIETKSFDIESFNYSFYFRGNDDSDSGEDVPSVPDIPTEFQSQSSNIPSNQPRYTLSDGNYSNDSSKSPVSSANSRPFAANSFNNNNRQSRGSINRKPSQVTRRNPSSVSRPSQFRSSATIPLTTSNSDFNPYASTSSNTSTSSNPKHVPSLFLPSQHKRHGHTTLEEQTSDIEDDTFRQSTASFVTAAENPSMENLNEVYKQGNNAHADNDKSLTQNLETLASENVNQVNRFTNQGFSPFAAKNLASTTAVSTPNYTSLQTTHPEDDQDTLEGSQTPTVASVSTTPELRGGAFSPNNHDNHTFEHASTPNHNDFTNDYNSFGKNQFKPPFAEPRLDSTLRAERDPNEENVSVDDLAKSISEEFATPEFTQSGPSESFPAVSSAQPAAANSQTLQSEPESTPNKPVNSWSRKDTFPDYEDDDFEDDYDDDYNDTIGSSDIKQNLNHENDDQVSQDEEQDTSLEIIEETKDHIPKDSLNHFPKQYENRDESREPLQENSQNSSNPADNQAETPVQNTEPASSGTRRGDVHKRDFSLTSYLDDYYNDSEDSDDLSRSKNHFDPAYNKASPDALRKSQGDEKHNQGHTAQPVFNSFGNSNDRKASTANNSSSTINTITTSGKSTGVGAEETRDAHAESSDDDVEIIDTMPSASRHSSSSDNASWDNSNDSKPKAPAHSAQLPHVPGSNISVENSSNFPTSVSKPSEPAYSAQNTLSFGDSESSHDSVPPLPLPHTKFSAGDGRFSAASDSLGSFGGNETDDTGSLSTGRFSPQSFMHSGRDSYDYRANSLNYNAAPRSGAADNFNRFSSSNGTANSSESPSHANNSLTPTTSRFNRLKQLDYASESEDFAVSSSGSVRAVAGTNSNNISAPATDHTSESDMTGVESRSDLLTPSQSDHISGLRINETHRLPSFSTYVDLDNTNQASGLNSQERQERDISIDTGELSQNYQNDNENKETPVSSEQNALLREINDLFTASTSSKNSDAGPQNESHDTSTFSTGRNLESGESNRFPKEEHGQYGVGAETDTNVIFNGSVDTLEYVGGKPSMVNVDNANKAGKPQSNQGAVPLTPMEPDPEIAELYQDSSHLLSRPVSQFLDPDSMIPQTQPLSPSRTPSSATTADTSKSDDTNRLEAWKEEHEKKELHEKEEPQERHITFDVDHNNDLSENSDSSDQLSTSTIDKDERSSSPVGHSRTASVGVKSLLLEGSPPLTPVHSERTQSPPGKHIRKASLMSLKGISLLGGKSQPKGPGVSRTGTLQSLSSRLNRPPIIDFQGVLSRPNSVDRKNVFDAAREAQSSYDSGLRTWLTQMTTESQRALNLSQVSAAVQDTNGAAGKKPQFFRAATNSIPSLPASRKMTSALSEVSNKTHGLANKLHINKVGGKSSNAAKGLFSKGRKFLKQGEK